MATRIHRRCDRGLKLRHIYQTYNVYLCHIDANLSISTTIQMWIHAGTSYNILHRNLGRKLWLISNRYPGSSSRLPQSTILSIWLQWSEVEHGRNHLITGQLCEPLTSVREIIINVNDSQGTPIHSYECEWMDWCRTLEWIFRSKVNDVNLCQERENLSLRHTDLKVLKMVLRLITRWWAEVDRSSLV